jgi:uncharacterized membrane protein YjfL (UPF0719 family)
MAWYHWIAVYCIIIGGILFTIISPKPLWLWGVIALLIIIGICWGYCYLTKKINMQIKRADNSALFLFGEVWE